jgi:hypothetical protein
MSTALVPVSENGLVKITNPELFELTEAAKAAWQEVHRLGAHYAACEAIQTKEFDSAYYYERVPRAKELLEIEHAAKEERDELWSHEVARRREFWDQTSQARSLVEDHALILGRILVKVKKALSKTTKTFIVWREETFGPDPDQKIANRCDYCVKKARHKDHVSLSHHRNPLGAEVVKARKQEAALEAIKRQNAAKEKAEETRRLAEETGTAEAIARAERMEKRLQNASKEADHRLQMVERIHREAVKNELDRECNAIASKLRDLCHSVLDGATTRKRFENMIASNPASQGFSGFKETVPSPLDIRAMSQLRFDFTATGNTIKQDIDALVAKVEAASHRKHFGFESAPVHEEVPVTA